MFSLWVLALQFVCRVSDGYSITSESSANVSAGLACPFVRLCCIQGSGGEFAGVLKELLWVRPDEIVQRIQQQQCKAQRVSRPQPQQQQLQEKPMQLQQPEKTAILFSSNRIASTVAQGILPSHAFAAAASGLAASNPRLIREALVHPQEWR